MRICFEDNSKSRALKPDGSYACHIRAPREKIRRAQEELPKEASTARRHLGEGFVPHLPKGE